MLGAYGGIDTEAMVLYMKTLLAVATLSASSCATVPPSASNLDASSSDTAVSDAPTQTTEPVSFTTLAGSPFQALPTRDGAWVFVSLMTADSECDRRSACRPWYDPRGRLPS